MRSYATYQNGGSYSTPWKWTKDTSTFEIDQRSTATDLFTQTQYTRAVRPGETFKPLSLLPAPEPKLAVWDTTSHATCHITFTPQNGEYTASHIIDIDYSLGKGLNPYVGGWIELSLTFAMSWGAKEAAPVDNSLVLDVDTSAIIANAATLGLHAHYRDNVYNVVYRVAGSLLGAKSLRLSLRYNCVWVSGESQTLFGEYVSSIVAATSLPFVETTPDALSSSAARPEADGSWEIV